MTSPRKPTEAEFRASMRASANRTRDVADEMARMYGGCDDPQHPFHLFDEDGKQAFTDWHDFTNRVCRPIVEAGSAYDTPEVQAAMALYRTWSPFSIAVSLVMALNRIEALEGEVETLTDR